MTIALPPDPVRSASAWGRSRCCRIADVTIALYSDDPALQRQPGGTSTRFLVEDTAPDVRVHATWGDLRQETCGAPIFDSGGLWQLFAEGDAYRFRFASPALGAAPYKVACFTRDFTDGQVILHRPYFFVHHLAAPLEYPLDELLLVHVLAQGKGLEVHACGVIDAAGHGHLFLGQSGAGKTTIAKLWQQEAGVTILSDDRIVLRQVDGQIWMYGTPWHGEAGLAWPARAPLTRLYFLRHGEANKLVPQRPSTSLGYLLACSFPPFYSVGALDFTLEFLAAVVKAVPGDELWFLPDRRIVACVQQAA